MQTGWEFIVAGRAFDPTPFFVSSNLCPISDTLRKWDTQDATSKYRVIEFFDWYEGAYQLDPVIEALDYLTANEQEFKILFNLPGVEIRRLNIVTHSEFFEINSLDLSKLSSLGITLSICTMPVEAVSKKSS